jgi:hypothetical protein
MKKLGKKLWQQRRQEKNQEKTFIKLKYSHKIYFTDNTHLLLQKSSTDLTNEEWEKVVLDFLTSGQAFKVNDLFINSHTIKYIEKL